ncbi:MAG: glycerophosphodiester phosphodiesterase [Candidatus Hydrogenedentes bacterium]|nr:glycerophosphodiester phosphodiesterase [Candidatus Hydrogenedentota bacterium]
MMYGVFLRYFSFTLLLVSAGAAQCVEPIVIAHRGASGYLPEHTLEAYAMAYGMGADYIEQDLVMTKDGRFVAMHDINLESTTNVEEQFPKRHRDDGKWYAVDFTLAEIKTLSVHERLKGRFPVGKSRFEVPTMEEAIELIQGLNQSTGRNVGIYPELKQPPFHKEVGFDVEARLLELLERYGYSGAKAKVYIQCFYPDSLLRIRQELKSELPLVQLISGHKMQADLRTRAGLEAVAKYANGIGPDKNIIEKNPDFATWAHGAGLVIHPYTVRVDDRPAKYATTKDELQQLFGVYKIDGVFIDFPDVGRDFLDSLSTDSLSTE